MRRTAVLSGLVLVGGLLGPSTAFADDQGAQHDKNQARWIAVEDHSTTVLPNGDTITGEDPNPGSMDPNAAPPAGTQLFVSEVLYETKDGRTRGDEVGRSHLQCTAQAVALTFRCDGALVFDDGSELLGSAVLDFSAADESFDIAVLGGTGEWFGATGALSHSDMSTAQETVSLYEADVVLPHR
jgi:hypothetical protein